MKRVSIYVDDKAWEEVRKCAWAMSSVDNRVSIGQYLMGLHEEKLEAVGVFLDTQPKGKK